MTTPPSGGGSITVTADGDYGSEFEFASILAEERTVGAIGRVGDDCEIAEGEFAVDPLELTRLAAERPSS